MRLLDQRDIHHAHTVDGQRDHWIMFLRDRRGGLVPIVDNRKVSAYVSDGRWVADCPNCNGGIACWDANPQGCCLDCGHVYEVVWHRDSKEAEAILTQRPNPFTRHWHPHRGETIDQLRMENVAHTAHNRASTQVAEGKALGKNATEIAADLKPQALPAPPKAITE